MTSYLINDRWINIPEDEIVRRLSRLRITGWGDRILKIGDDDRHYLFGRNYAYPYSLPRDVVKRLAGRLNETRYDDMWYQNYNEQAIEYFNQHGMALNQAADYWADNGDVNLPRPEILPVGGLNNGDVYIAIIGLFHLTGVENQGNHHLFIDLLDQDGFRIYDNTLGLHYKWVGMRDDEAPDPVFIDKPGTEPGANIGLTSGQILLGFDVDNWKSDQFQGVHTLYGDDEAGNSIGHHSHYIVLQKRQYQVNIPNPPRISGVINLTIDAEYIKSLPPDEAGNVNIILEISGE